MVTKGYQWLSVVIIGYWLSTSYQCLPRVINGYQLVIRCNQWLLVFNKLSVVIKGYQWLSLVIIGYWLSTSYQWLSRVINGYQLVISSYQW